MNNFTFRSDGSVICNHCGETAVFPYEANEPKVQKKLCLAHLEVCDDGSDYDDSPSKRNSIVKKDYEKQVEKMGDLIEDE